MGLCTKSVSAGRKSGGKPAFLTLSLLDLLDCFRLKAIFAEDHSLNSNQLRVRKVGLPPLLCTFCVLR